MIPTKVPEKQLYSELRSLQPWPGKKHMGRPRDNMAWAMVDCDPEDPKRWTCRHCMKSFSGSVTRVKQHLAQIRRRQISPCLRVPGEVQELALLLLQSNVAPAPALNELWIRINQLMFQISQIPIGSYEPPQVQAAATSPQDQSPYSFMETLPDLPDGLISHGVPSGIRNE